MATDVVSRFFELVEAFEITRGLNDRLDDLADRIHRANVAHERFVTNRMNVS
jgi:hypothetical protein